MVLKSRDAPPKKSMKELIGTDESSPYWPFWDLMRLWPASSNQRPLTSAAEFVRAVDEGTSARSIVDAAQSLLSTSQFVTRLDVWLGQYGYLAYLQPETNQVFKVKAP
jgi:hypothetical protein